MTAVRGDVDGRLADLIDGSIGESSMFHDTSGYYAQGVVESTAQLPDGWQLRLVRFETPATRGVTAWCLDLHDLWIAKAIAGREKDSEFCRALLAIGVVPRPQLRQRLAEVPALILLRTRQPPNVDHQSPVRVDDGSCNVAFPKEPARSKR